MEEDQASVKVVQHVQQDGSSGSSPDERLFYDGPIVIVG